MYATCLYCHADLGKNEIIASFPVGRRLAFDSANGRFWVICAACKRWNLSPLEERWNAMDECERLFERTRLRMSTDNIGLARVGEGTELVRVGAAMRPEMAAWRFGAQLAARRRQYRWLVAGGVIAVGGFYAGIAAAGASIAAFQGIWGAVQRGYERATRLMLPTPAASIEDPNNPGWRWAAGIDRRQTDAEIARAVERPRVESSHVRNAKLVIEPDESAVRLTLPVVGRRVAEYRADQTASVLPKVVAKLNRFGGRKEDEKLAVEMLASVASDGAPDLATGLLKRYVGRSAESKTLGEFGGVTNIALEMALQEQRERELLAGELIELEFAWKEAEELARISDTLESSAIDAALARLKRRIEG